MDNDFFEEVSALVGERVRVQTADSTYRGICKSIDRETCSLVLGDVEQLTLYGHPSEEEEEEWNYLSEKIMIHGDFLETVAIEED